MIIARLISLLIGYLFGLIQTSYIYGKFKGVDIRTLGSKNAGTTNALRTMGKKAGIITVIGDIGKSILAVMVITLIFQGKFSNNIDLLKLYAGVGVILGHNFPFYLGFRGGKGIASTIGLSLALSPWTGPIGLIVFCIAFLTSHYVSVASLSFYTGFLATVIIFSRFDLLFIQSVHRFEAVIIMILLWALAIYSHRENIIRLKEGREPQTFLRKKDKDEK